MLVLTRKRGESIMINDNIEIIMIESDRGKVRIGIVAPREYPIYRKEIYDNMKKDNESSHGS